MDIDAEKSGLRSPPRGDVAASGFLTNIRRCCTKKNIAGHILVWSILLYLWRFLPVAEAILALANACKWIHSHKVAGAFLFIPFEVCWVFCGIPATPLEIAAGYAFGFGWGFVVDSIGKWCGGLISFLAGRHCLRDLVARWLDGGGSPGGFGSLLSAVDRVLNSRGADSRESFQLLLLIELAYIPVALKNYGLSMTSVPFVNFAVAAAIGETPGSIAATWMGASCRDLVGLLTGASRMSGPAMKARVAVMVGGSLSLVLVIGLIGRRINSQLKALEEEQENSPSSSSSSSSSSLLRDAAGNEMDDQEDLATPTTVLVLERRGPQRSASKQKLSEDLDENGLGEEQFFLGAPPLPLSASALQ